MRVPALLTLAVLALSVPVAGQRLEVPDAGPGRLRAERVRYDARTQTFHAEGNVRLSLGDLVVEAPRLHIDQRRRTVQATGGVLVRQAGTLLRGRELLYEITPRLAHLTGDVRLAHDGIAVAAGAMTLDFGAQVVGGRGGVQLTREGATVTGDEMVVHLRTQQVQVAGHAVLTRPAAVPPAAQDRTLQPLAAQETRIAAQRLRLQWEANEVEAEGAVLLTQPERTARAGRVVYSEARGVIELTGSVEVEQRSEAPAAPVQLWADRVVVRLETRDMQADGHVKVAQEGRQATGDRATYTARDQTIVVLGHVRLREADGSWLRADRVVIAIADETFEATGNVESEFTVPRGK